ncbi:uncharacterized protein LOC133898579 [Phragmites australis]|uniref:uncharacterized protein LOC133898579 n=1 Tax=Phragmites australis TaxID=29695 RepID=UPI002D782881|nr:uncharacterized protein LOC133898579 [Phragmites australis]
MQHAACVSLARAIAAKRSPASAFISRSHACHSSQAPWQHSFPFVCTIAARCTWCIHVVGEGNGSVGEGVDGDQQGEGDVGSDGTLGQGAGVVGDQLGEGDGGEEQDVDGDQLGEGDAGTEGTLGLVGAHGRGGTRLGLACRGRTRIGLAGRGHAGFRVSGKGNAEHVSGVGITGRGHGTLGLVGREHCSLGVVGRGHVSIGLSGEGNAKLVRSGRGHAGFEVPGEGNDGRDHGTQLGLAGRGRAGLGRAGCDVAGMAAERRAELENVGRMYELLEKELRFMTLAHEEQYTMPSLEVLERNLEAAMYKVRYDKRCSYYTAPLPFAKVTFLISSLPLNL